MLNLLISPNTDEHTSPSDFKARVSGSTLLLPIDLADMLARAQIRTAIQFVVYVKSFPSALAEMLAWKRSEVEEASQRLESQLKGFVPEDILNPPAAPARKYGVTHPLDDVAS